MEIKTKKIFISILTLVKLVLFSDVIYGYNALLPIYKAHGVFTNMTINNSLFKNKSIKLNHNDESRYFSDGLITWVTSQALLAPLVGLFLDSFGIKNTLLFGSVLSALGSHLFSITQYKPHLFYIAGCCVSNSATFIVMGCIQLSHILREKQSLLISLQIGLMSASSVVHLFIKKLYDFLDMPLYASFNILCILALTIIGTSSILFIKHTADATLQKRIYKIKNSPDDGLLPKCRLIRINYLNENFPTLYASITSLKYWTTSLFYFCINYRYVFLVSQFNYQINALFNDEKTKESLLELTGILLGLGLIPSALTGILINFLDKQTVQRNFFNNIESKDDILKKNEQLNQILALPFLFCVLLNLIGSLIINIANYFTVCLAVLLFSFSRWMALCLFLSSISSSFPVHHCGELIGASIFFIGLFMPTMYLIMPFARHDHLPFYVNELLILCPVFAMVHPVVLYYF